MSDFNFTEAYKSLCACRQAEFRTVTCKEYEQAIGTLPCIKQTMEAAKTHDFPYTPGMVKVCDLQKLHDTIAAKKGPPKKARTNDTGKREPNKNHLFYVDLLSIGRPFGQPKKQKKSPISDAKRNAFFEKITRCDPPNLSDWVSIEERPENVSRLVDIVDLYLGEDYEKNI